jgi:hypothetical protein
VVSEGRGDEEDDAPDRKAVCPGRVEGELVRAAWARVVEDMVAVPMAKTIEQRSLPARPLPPVPVRQ